MGRRGLKTRFHLDHEYWRLVSAGMSNVRAYRYLGSGRKTGFRWRRENGGLSSVRLGKAPCPNRYLSLLKRQRIAALLERGHGVGAMARLPERVPSTISSEPRRSCIPSHRAGYDGDLAHARARERAKRPNRHASPLTTSSGPSWPSSSGLNGALNESPSTGVASTPTSPPGLFASRPFTRAFYVAGRAGLARAFTKKLRTSRPTRQRRRRPDRCKMRFATPALERHVQGVCNQLYAHVVSHCPGRQPPCWPGR